MDRDNQTRLFIMILSVMFMVLFGRLWQLQILEASTFKKMSQENTTRTILEIAPRGIIYDRYGKVIVTNKAIFSAYLFPSGVEKEKLIRVVSEVSRITGVPKDKIQKKIDDNKKRTFEPVLIKNDISIKTVTALEERRHNLPGVVVSVKPVRYYPNRSLAAHVLGYVGEITKNELDRMRDKGYQLKDLIGKEGVESAYDKYLRGVDGGQQLEIDVYGRPVRTVGNRDPDPGADIRLTIDLELQKVVENNLEDKRGAVIVMDPRNGEILAMASRPTYDPTVFTGPMEQWEWEKMDRQGHPFLNRALSTYPPGSTFKVVTLSSTLQERKATLSETFECKGRFILGNRVAKCWLETGHGKQTIIEGLVNSCDIVFYELGLRNGPGFLSKYAKGYGLGQRTGIDLPGELSGLVPDEDWKKRVLKDVWVKGDSINYAIGQGFLIVTPIQMANVYGTIATSKRYVPHVVDRIYSREGKPLFKYKTQELAESPISNDNLNMLRATLRQVVIRGTGIASEVQGLPAAGKTGTAENPGLAHAWFMCFAPYDRPEIVIINFVEHGEHGDRVTARMSREILKWYKDNRLSSSSKQTLEPSKRI